MVFNFSANWFDLAMAQRKNAELQATADQSSLSAEELQVEANVLRTSLRRAETDVERLTLYVSYLGSLLVEHGVATAEEVQAKLQEVEQKAVAAGKLTPAVAAGHCSHCGEAIKYHPCPYCGHR